MLDEAAAVVEQKISTRIDLSSVGLSACAQNSSNPYKDHAKCKQELDQVAKLVGLVVAVLLTVMFGCCMMALVVRKLWILCLKPIVIRHLNRRGATRLKEDNPPSSRSAAPAQEVELNGEHHPTTQT